MREFLCLQCGNRDSSDTFGYHCRCPRCSSIDVIDYNLWTRYAAESPPPRRPNPHRDDPETAG